MDFDDSARLKIELAKAEALKQLRPFLQNPAGRWFRLRENTHPSESEEAIRVYLLRIVYAYLRALIDSEVFPPDIDIEAFVNGAVEVAKKFVNHREVDRIADEIRASLVDTCRVAYLAELDRYRQIAKSWPPLRDPVNYDADEEQRSRERSAMDRVRAESEAIWDAHYGDSASDVNELDPTQRKPEDGERADSRAALPNLPREALIRIEQSEKDAREVYDRDKVPYLPTNPEFSFLETSIFQSISHIVDYVRLFAEAVLDAHLKEYLEYAPSDLLTNESLLRSIGTNIWRLTDELWKGYGLTLQFEPASRRARHEIAAAKGTIDEYPHLEPWQYPDSQRWADFITLMAEPESEMARLNGRYETAIKKAIFDQIKRYQSDALARLGAKGSDAQGEKNSGREPPSGVAAHSPSEPTKTATDIDGAGPATEQSELPQNVPTPFEDEVIRPEFPPWSEGGVTAGSSPGQHRLFAKSGDVWELAFDDEKVHVKHTKGMEYIAHLLRLPDRGVHSVRLFMAIAGEFGTPVVASAGEVLDPAALAQYRSRIEDLKNQLREAERNNDEGRREAAHAELEQLQEQVISAVGLHGRRRNAHDSADKIRKSVGNAIKRAIASIREHHPALAEHLRLRIKRGAFLRYEGDGIDWEFRLIQDPPHSNRTSCG